MDSMLMMNAHRSVETAEEEFVSRLAQEENEMTIGPVMQSALLAMENQRRSAELVERMNAEQNDAWLMQKFLRTKFSADVLKTNYVREHRDECMRNIELIGHISRRISRFTGKNAERVRQKFDAVREYPDVVERALLEEQLEIIEVEKDEEEFIWRLQAYRENSALRYYLALRRYKSIEKNQGRVPDEYRVDPMRTRIEEKLSELEAELQLSRYVEASDRILRTESRNIGVVERVNVGGEIRPEIDVKGEREHRLIKKRMYEIFERLKWKLAERIGGGARAFIALEGVVKNYVFLNWDRYEDVRTEEEKEVGALEALKSALNRVYLTAGNECSGCAAILLGLLTEESSGYLEIPPNGIQIVREDKNITCGRQCEYRERKNMPLFTHRPNIKDIAQGGLGDCYLLAGLISVVNQNPEEIMKIMRDNGNGTVTVCFKLEEAGNNGESVFTPYYVTVQKTIPILRRGESDAFSRGALWVKMMEKAYVASGIHLLRRINENLQRDRKQPQKYSDFLQMIQDEDKRLDYDEINDGLSGPFISLLLGKESEIHFPVINTTRYTEFRVNKVRQPVNRTRRNQRMQPAHRFSRDKKAASGKRDHLSRRIKERRRKGADIIDLEISKIEAEILENIGDMQNGHYTIEELNLYEDIENALQDKFCVTFGTKYLGGDRTGMNGETESGGLVGNHAYAILGTRTELSNGREYLFLLVMNPWAQKGVVYDARETSIRKRADLLQEERGVFPLDLKTFAKVVCCWEAVREREN